MTTAISKNAPALPPHLDAWANGFKERPKLATPSSSGASPYTFDSNKIVVVPPPQTNRANELAGWLRAKWDRGTLVCVTKLATPSLFLGLILTLVGFTGFISAVSSLRIPGLGFLVDHMPASVVLSLTLIRAGLHSISKGVRLSRRHQRFRLDLARTLHLARIENKAQPLSEQEIVAKEREIARLNNRLPPAYRLDKAMRASDLYGKEADDLSTTANESNVYRTAVAASLEKANAHELLEKLPDLDKPAPFSTLKTKTAPKTVNTKAANKLEVPVKFSTTWHDWWLKKLPALGILDVAVGQLMLVCGIGALVIMFLKSNQVPQIFEILSHDPGVSLSFGFILMANWINCSRTGWRMLNFKMREKRRNAASENDLQLIDLLSEKKRVQELHNWILPQIQDEAVKRELNEAVEAYMESLPKDLETRIEKAHLLRAEGREITSKSWPAVLVHNLGRKTVHNLATPTLLLGLIVSLLGAICLVMSITHHIPSHLELLTDHTPLSVLFSFSLIVAGFHAAHRGVAMRDRQRIKDPQKKSSRKSREALLGELTKTTPKLKLPRTRRASLSDLDPKAKISLRLPTDVQTDKRPTSVLASAHINAVKEAAQTTSERWYGFWGKTLNVACVPNFMIGTFLLVAGLAGIAFFLGAPVPENLIFITKDPSYSIFFCISLLGIGVDALNTSWRMFKYNERKQLHGTQTDVLEMATKKLIKA